MDELIEKKIPKLPKQGEGLLLSGDKVFFTIQGEGPSTGLPAIFIRLHMCNLECVFEGGEICDAWYTWKKNSNEYWTEHTLWSYERIVEEIRSFNCYRLVITGGEPLLQQERILEFFLNLQELYIIEIETNGTIIPNKLFVPYDMADLVQFNCSPKLSTSGNSVKRSIVPAALKEINNYKNSNFKFVATSLRDLEEIQEIVNLYELNNNKIIIMPEGTSIEILSKRMQELVNPVRDLQWRLTPRLQCQIWGNKRGV